MKYYFAIAIVIMLLGYFVTIHHQLDKGQRGFGYLMLGMIGLIIFINYADSKAVKKRNKKDRN